MANFNTLIGGSSAAQRLIDQSREAGSIFPEANWDQVGSDVKLTNFLHQALDPNGSKYGGDTSALKDDLLNTVTTRGSSAILSLIDWGNSLGESQQKKQFQNLVGRLYESAPNRLLSGNLGDAAQALGAGLLGGAVVDAALLPLIAPVKGALGIGMAAEKAIGRTALNKAALALSSGGEGALKAAESGLVKDMAWNTAKLSAKENAVEEGIIGGIGDIGQQNAAMNRELQDGYSLTQAGLNTVGSAAIGGALGAAVGGVRGFMGGKKEIAQGGIQDQVLKNAIAEKQKADALLASEKEAKLKQQEEQGGSIDPNFVSLADAWRNVAGNIADSADEVSRFTNLVTAGYEKSAYTPAQLGAIRNALTNFRGSPELSESLKAQANSLRAAAPDGTPAKPEAVAKAFELEQQATRYESVVKYLDSLDLAASDSIMKNGDISPDLVRGLSELDPALAKALAVEPDPTTSTVTTTSKPDGVTTQKVSVASSAAPSAATTTVANKVLTDTPAGTAPPAIKQTESVLPTASDATAVSTADAAAQATQTPQAVAQGIQTTAPATAVQQPAQVVEKANLSTETQGASENIAQQATEQAPATTSETPVVQDGSPAGAAVTPEAKTATSENVDQLGAAKVNAAEDGTVVKEASVDAVTPEEQKRINELEESMAASTAAIDYANTKLEMKQQREDAVNVLEAALKDIGTEQAKLEGKLKLTAAEKTGIVKKALDKAKQENPDLAPLFDYLDASKMTTAKGIAEARVTLEEVALQSIDFTYAKVISEILPDPTNVNDFADVVRAMLRGPVAEDAARMIESYRKMVHNALYDRIAAVGIKNVSDDKVLGPAWRRLVGGFDPKKKSEITRNINDVIVDAAKSFSIRDKDSGIYIQKATETLRDFYNQLKTALDQSDIPIDDMFIQRALEARAKRALAEEVAGTFAEKNAIAFDKIEKMRELRERDEGGTRFVRTVNHLRNPFYESMVENPILDRVAAGTDEYGDTIYKDMIVSGRQLEPGDKGSRKVSNRPQSILSDGISDYLGLIWAHPRKIFGAVNSARNAILGSAIKVASDSRGRMVINGKMVSGAMSQLKGLYAETANDNIARIRFSTIVDLVRRRHLEEGEEGRLNNAQYEEKIAKLGSHSHPVTESELEIAEMMSSYRQLMDSDLATVQRSISDVLKDAKDMGENASDKIMGIVAKFNEVKVRNNNNLLNSLSGYTNKAIDTVGNGGAKRKGGQMKGSAAVEKPRVKSVYAATISDNGTYAPASTDSTHSVVLSMDGKRNGDLRMFNPDEHIKLVNGGDVTLFGEKIGTWNYDMNAPREARKAIINVNGISGEEIANLSALSRNSFVVNHKALFDKNMASLPKAPDGAHRGDKIDITLTDAEVQKAAVEKLTNKASPVSPENMKKKIADFDMPKADNGVPTRVVAILDKSSGHIHKPGKSSYDSTIEEFAQAVHVDPKNIKLVSVPAGVLKKNGKMVNEGTQAALLRMSTELGDTTVKADPDLAAAIAAKDSKVAPELLKAKSTHISMNEAGEIKFSDGESLGHAYTKFVSSIAGLKWSSISTIDGLNALVSRLSSQAEKIESLAPHGIKMKNASRRTSFGYLQQIMAKFDPEEQQSALDILRRIDMPEAGDKGMSYPYFREGKGDNYSPSSNNVNISKEDALGGSIPKHVAVAHEVGHWSFVNMLTPSEQVQFVKSLAKHYGADGKLDIASITKDLPHVKEIEKITGKSIKGLLDDTNELFAWKFTNWYMDNAVGRAGEAAEATLWKRVVKIAKNLLSHFLGKKVDTELHPMFERILPSTISESRYTYGSLLDVSTGKTVDLASLDGSNRKPAVFIHDIAQKLDALRARLGQQVLTPGGVIDVSFIEDLKSATNHMFGLLYGKDKAADGYMQSATVKAIRSDLFRLKNSDGTDRTGAINPDEMFSRHGIGSLMTEIRALTPEGVADDVAFEAAMDAEHFFAVVKDTTINSNPEAALQYKQSIITEYEKLIKAGKSPEDALDAAELVAMRELAGDGFDKANALFNPDGSKVVLGDAEQRKLLGAMARNLYDLMGDALDNLDVEMHGFGYRLPSNKRANVNIDVAPAVEEKVASSAAEIAKKKPAPKRTAKPKTEAAKKIEKMEEEARSVDESTEGMPAGAPSQFQMLVRGIPHRDEGKNNVIGDVAFQIFTFLSKDGDHQITNGDIAAITGSRLGKGVSADALADSGLKEFEGSTEAFDALRKSLRIIADELSGKERSTKELDALLSRVVSKDMADDLSARYGNEASEVGGMPEKVNDSYVAGVVWNALTGMEPATSKMRQIMFDTDVADAVATAKYMKSKITKMIDAATGDSESGVSQNSLSALGKYADGSVHPALARNIVEARLNSLPQGIRNDILEWAGAAGGDSDISKYIGFVYEGEPLKVYTTIGDMLDSADEASATIASEIAIAKSRRDHGALRTLVAKAEAMEIPGVIPVLFKSNGLVSDANKLSKAALKKQGSTGVIKDGIATMVDSTAVKNMDDMISKFNKLKRNQVNTDVPVGGEVILNLALDDTTPMHPMALEQRALDAGAPAGIASFFSGLFKKSWRKAEGPTDSQVAEIATFSGLQMRSNPSRIRKAGGTWLADIQMPEEGAGFEQRLMTSMGSSLLPLTSALDELSRPTGFISGKLLDRTTWYGKSISEIYRNADMRAHRVPQTEVEDQIVQALRTGDLSKLSPEAKQYSLKLRDHFRKLLIAQNEAGIPVGDITDGTNQFYLPQRFNTNWIAAHREDAIRRLANYFTKDRGGNSTRSLIDATRVIDDAINREELNGVLDGASTTYMQAFGDKLHSRQLRFSAGDWSSDGVGPLFDSNLRSLITSYTEAAHKRIEWSNSFGVRGHGAATYADIALNGSDAVKKALMGKAEGLTQIGAKFDRGIVDVELGGVPDVEFTESLFSPMSPTAEDAAYVTRFIMDKLDQSKSKETRQALVDVLVERFKKNGGQGSDHFKMRAAAIVNGLADFGDQGGKVSKGEVEFMLRTVGVLEGRPAYTITANQTARSIAGGVKTFNSVSLLSGVVLSSLPDTVLPLMRSGSMGNWLKGTAKAVKLASSDPATAAAMQRVGVLMDSILSENLSNVNGGISNRLNNAFFNATLLTPWTNTMRQAAALTGFESIKANQVIAQRELAAGRTDSWKYRKSIRYLRQLGLAELVHSEKLDTFTMAVNDPRGATNDAIASSNAKVAQAINRFVSEAVFQPNRSDIPLWAQDPIASIFWQFKSYPMMLGRLVKHNFKEAIATEGGKYAGDPMGLMYLLTVGSAAGFGSLAAKDYLLGKNQESDSGNWRSLRDRNLSRIVQEFGFKDYQMQNGEVDAFLGAYAEGLLSIGALGLLADLMYQSARSVDNGAYGRERITSQILGPAMGTFNDALQIVDGVAHSLTSDSEGNYKERNAVRKVLRRVPVLGGQDPVVEGWIDWAAGEKQQ